MFNRLLVPSVKLAVAGSILGMLAVLAACQSSGSTPKESAMSSGDVKVSPVDLAKEPIQPLPTAKQYFENEELDWIPERIALGKRLFHDPRLSNDDTLSCAGCHDLRYAGIDRAVSATGIRGQIGPINTPTVFNAALNIDQFWNGRADTLEAQADGPPNAGGEMGSNWQEILGKLRADSSYLPAFQAAFPDENIGSQDDIKSEQVLSAISDFERTLITPDSSFDRYLRGDASAISQQAKQGYQLFKDVGCTECHYGSSIGGKTYQPLGRKRDYFETRGHITPVDMGRFNVTKDERDKHVFKVPSLRNIALTAPYLHDGSQPSLPAVVRTMGRTQLDIDLSDGQVALIVEFLGTLNGQYEGKALDKHQNTPQSPAVH